MYSNYQQIQHCEKDYDDKINYAITLQIYNIIKLLHDKESAIGFGNYSSLPYVSKLI